MFNNPFLKKDPLLEAVKAAQADGEMRRQAEAIVNEEFGVYSRQAVVREDLAAYDAALEDIYEALKGNQDKIDLNKNKRIDAGDFKMLRDRKKHMEESEALSPKEKSLAALGSPKDKITKKDVLIGRGVLPKEKMEEKKMWEGSEDTGTNQPTQASKDIAAKTASQTPERSYADRGPSAADKAALTSKMKAMEEESYGVYRKGGSIGERDKSDHPKHGKLTKTFDSADEAKSHAKGMNKVLSPGEKTYYRMKYHVKAIKEAQLDELTGKGKLPHMKANYQDAKNIHSKEADWHAARADRHERRGEDDKAEHHMDVGSEHEHKAERAGSKLKRANALMTRAKAVSDIKSSKAASKSARAEYKEETQIGEARLSEIAMTTPPAIVQPAVPSMKQTAPGIKSTGQFGRQGASARPMRPTSQSVPRGMSNPLKSPSGISNPLKSPTSSFSPTTSASSASTGGEIGRAHV